MESPKILILEDEFIVAEDMAIQLGKAGFRISGIFDNGKDTLESFSSDTPDIVLIDINIQGDIDGIQTAEKIQEHSSVPLIFITAYSGSVYFERAKKVKPHAYLVKPFNHLNLFTSIELALFNYQASREKDEPSPSSEALDDKARTGNYLVNGFIFLKKQNHFDKVHVRDILYLEADGSYCQIITREGKYTLSQNLQNVLNNMGSTNIIRSHRSFAVNLDRVTSYTKSSVFVEKHEIPVSYFYKKALMEKLKIL